MSLRRNNYLFLTLLLVLLGCDTKHDFEGEFQNYFIKYYGEDGNQDAVDMLVNDDGTVLLLGTTQVLGKSKRIMLLKVDAKGNVLWQKRYGVVNGEDDEIAQDLEPTVDGNFLILSNTFYRTDPGTNDNIYDFKVLRIRGDGSVIDSMYFDNNGGQWTTQLAYSITALSNGGFAVTGNSADENTYFDPPNSQADLEDLFAVGFNSDFTRAWTTVEDKVTEAPPPGMSLGEHIGSGIKVIEKSPSEFYWFTYSDGLRPADVVYESNFNVWRFNGSGVSFGEVFFSGEESRQERLASVIQVPAALGGGYYELGTSAINNGIVVNPDAWGNFYFCRRNSTRELISEGIVTGLTGTFLAHVVAPAVYSRGFLLLGHEQTTLGSTIRLVQVDQSSVPRWSTTFGAFDKNSRGAAVAELPDGRILVLGTIELETQRKIALFKLNAKGELLD
jgi:hypothetical protein